VSHMVIYRGADGKPGYQQAEDIHDAVAFVEQMRNEDGVEHARIFRLEEVVFEYRPYYRVELSGLDAAEAPLSPEAILGVNVPRMAPTPRVEVDEPLVSHLNESFEMVGAMSINVDEPELEAAVASNGARRGLFGR